MRKFLFYIIFLTTLLPAKNIYLDMSLEELYNVEVIETASKKPEDLFEAPLSVTIIKKDDIEKAGFESIPEALRLVPGVIVREQSEGNYDVHIRGFDDITTSFIMPLPTNTIILVMIDGRIVYDYYSGGTFWETLPIGIHDVERIEVVRGPASALYGPNAVQGVVNIITKNTADYKISSDINVSGVTTANQRQVGNARISSKINDWFSAGFSYNSSIQKRLNNEYYSWLGKDFYSFEKLYHSSYFQPLDELQYYYVYDAPEHDLTLEQAGSNIFLDFDINEKFSYDVTGGGQFSTSLKPYYNNFTTPYSQYDSESRYVNFNGKTMNLHHKLSFRKGERRNQFYRNDYAFEILDSQLEYDFTYKTFTLRPGYNYRKADYKSVMLSDSTYHDYKKIPDETKELYSNAFSCLLDWRIFKPFRIIGAYRLDDYNIGSNITSYEIGGTYRLNKSNLFRFVHSVSSMSPFMMYSYFSNNIGLVILADDNPQQQVIMTFLGNENLDYTRNTTYEIGWRYKQSKNFTIDLELFRSKLDNLTELDHIDDFPQEFYLERRMKFMNIDDLSATQLGGTISLDYAANSNLNFNAYCTFQNTEYDSNDENFANEKKQSTPECWGGISADITVTPKFNIYTLINYMSEQDYTYESISQEFQTMHIRDYATMDLKLTYKNSENVKFYVKAENLLGKHREYGFTEALEPWQTSIGVQYKFNK
jgi:iron complex outermembrane receptor protein